MQLFSAFRAGWLVAAYYVGAVQAATNATSGIMEVDLVFPRNETYALNGTFPIVFAIKNPELVPLLINTITFTVHEWEELENFAVADSFDLRWKNYSSDPLFVYHTFAGLDNEAVWWLTWDVTWASCTEESLSKRNITYDSYSTSLAFTTSNSGQAVNLVAGTASDDCPAISGVAVEVASTLDVPVGVDWENGDTCAVLAETTPSATPCEVKIDAATEASMAASIADNACRATAVVGCGSSGDDGESAGGRLAVGAVTLSTAALGALGFVLQSVV
ncbi:hypothetical protein BJ166DRAFT_129537 [Pestalotiopsis sp. NC0098]|nr:hypothetical protein BJ166DRAFT_129537 [Pestalotiopsis sp. NC0098]